MGNCSSTKGYTSRVGSLVSDDLNNDLISLLPNEHKEKILEILKEDCSIPSVNTSQVSGYSQDRRQMSGYSQDRRQMTPEDFLTLYDNKDGNLQIHIRQNSNIKDLIQQRVDILREKFGKPVYIQATIDELQDNEIKLEASKMDKETKYVLVMGLSGHGKTTLLNSLANYITYPGHQMCENTKRARLIRQEQRQASVSQTQEITLYKLNYNGKPFVFIDTPGLADTEGQDKDEKIFEKITNFMSEQNARIDFIFFVTQANSKLDVGENEMLKLQQIPRFLRIFSFHLAPRIFHLVTFSDLTDTDPRMFGVNSIFYKQIQKGGKKIYHFQNSVTYLERVECYHKYYYSKNQQNYKGVMDQLCSLKQIQVDEYEEAKKIISAAKELNVIKSAALDKLKEFTKCLQENEQNDRTLKRAQQGQTDYKNFEYYRQKIVQKTVYCEAGHNVTLCQKCKSTVECHSDCAQTSETLIHCTYFWEDKKNNTKICYKCGCDWKEHKNQNFRLVDEYQSEKIENQQLKRMFEDFTRTYETMNQAINENKEIQKQCMKIIRQQYLKLRHTIILLNESSLFEFKKGQDPIDLIISQNKEYSNIIRTVQEYFFQDEYLKDQFIKSWNLYQKCQQNNRLLTERSNQSVQISQITIEEKRKELKSMYCKKCSFDCHFNCKFQKEGDEQKFCKLLQPDGKCKFCSHSNEQHQLQEVIEYDYQEVVIGEQEESQKQINQSFQEQLNKSKDILRKSIMKYRNFSKLMGQEGDCLDEIIQKQEQEEFKSFMSGETQEIE